MFSLHVSRDMQVQNRFDEKDSLFGAEHSEAAVIRVILGLNAVLNVNHVSQRLVFRMRLTAFLSDCRVSI